MKNIRRAVWGMIFVIAAIVIALNSFEIIDFNLFFDGWWTLFIIVPSFVDLIGNKNKGSSLFGLLFGIFLLLCAQDVLEFDMIWKIFVPALIAYWGIKMIISSFRKNKTDRIIQEIKTKGSDLQNGIAVFCGTEMDFDNVVFNGANLTAVFGGIECDLRRSIINCDCVIKVCTLFGGIDIQVPDNVRIVTNTTSIFGGIDVEKSNSSGMHTIYIEGICAFGGLDIK